MAKKTSDVNQTLETKLKHLKITRDKTETIIKSNNYERIERHREALKVLVNVVDACKREVEEFKITSGEDVDNSAEWCVKVEEAIAEVDDDLVRLRKWITQTEDEINEKVLQIE